MGTPAGTWDTTGYGSCVTCDPDLNPNDWTYLGTGEACEVMASPAFSGETFASVPVTGRCSAEEHCLVTYAAGFCDGDFYGCPGGFCNDAGWCEVDQNLGWFDSCSGLLGMLTVATVSNPCAQGPCCLDAGYGGIPDGGGWCCGLIDGGVQTCLGSNQVCFVSSDCCKGLSCVGTDAVALPVFSRDSGYGFCIPN
jgi:hypothetical protein